MAAMLVDIQSFNFLYFAGSEADGRGKNLKEDKGAAERPDKGGADSGELGNDEMSGGAAYIKQAGGQGAPGSAYPVHGNSADGIINLYPVNK